MEADAPPRRTSETQGEACCEYHVIVNFLVTVMVDSLNVYLWVIVHISVQSAFGSLYWPGILIIAQALQSCFVFAVVVSTD